MAIRYKGFSTHNKNFSNSFTLSGFELAKQDLLNHFNIRKGEKLFNPTFGSIIWDSLYEPLTDIQAQNIEDDIKEIISYDPRIEAESVLVDQYENGMMIQLELKYIPDQIVQNLLFDFNTSNTQATLSTA
jgi:phage baseplate assembly protein W